MKPYHFDYVDPTTVNEVLSVLGQYGDSAKLLAGGQSLVPMLNFRLARPGYLVDLNTVSGLSYIRTSGEGLEIGALTRQTELLRSPLVREASPFLAEVTEWIGHPQTRNRGTLAGSLAHNDPVAEYPAAALLLNMSVRTRSPRGERIIPADALLGSLYTTALAPDELIVETRVPNPGAEAVFAFEEFALRHGDYALAGVGVRLSVQTDRRTCRDIAVVLIGAGPRAAHAVAAEQVLRGEVLTDALLQEAGERASAGAEPSSDVHAAADYRRHLVKVLVPQAIRKAMARIGGPR